MTDKRLWIIFLIVFANLLGFGLILPLLPYYVESLGAGALTIGMVTASYSFTQLVAAPILGELSDKFGRRPVLLASIMGTTLSFILLAMSSTVWMLYLSRMIDGASGGNIATAQAYIADITTKKKRTQGMGILVAAFGLGFILGPALGGILSVYGYWVPALFAAALSFLTTVATYLFLPETIKKPASINLSTLKTTKKPKIELKSFFDAINHPHIGELLTIAFFVMLAFAILQGSFVLFTEHTHGLTARENGLMFALIGIIGVFSMVVLLKPLTKWFSDKLIIQTGLIGMALSLFILAIGKTIYSLTIAVVLFSFANSILAPVLVGAISKRVPEKEQGNIAGLNQSVGSAATLLGPIFGTFAYSRLGHQSPFFILTVMLIGTTIYTRKLSKN